MMNHDYRTMIAQFTSLPPDNTQPYTARLSIERPSSEYIQLDAVPGSSSSSIEKMTHPLAGSHKSTEMSPYMISLLGDQASLRFAEKVFQSPKQRLFDQWGIDNTCQSYTDKCTQLDTIVRFYFRDQQSQLKKIELNGQPFIEQQPTKPYFLGQKVITPDFTIHRAQEQQQKNTLLQSKTRDDCALYFNKQPILDLQTYNDQVYKQESQIRQGNNFLNEAKYFIPMVEYLTHFGQIKDLLVQNSLECSSDENTPHFQFIPHDVKLPLLQQKTLPSDNEKYKWVDWFLPTLCIEMDSAKVDWQEQTLLIQDFCQKLSGEKHISTTSVFQHLGDRQVNMYLIFKNDESRLTPEQLKQSPGWLESCGVFITDTPKATLFTHQGAEQYYAPYGELEIDKQQILATLEQHINYN
ncbi:MULTISPECIES: hypothetical protein [Providencia]|uniref:hypothetical protein n=1 Tax=Providencia TaxID=586 RepID=UPI001419C71A|nr:MULTISPECIES: hypothetical protein [Providencia]EJD6402343.1 hypothetical protein [Providencia rettgeri]EJD6583407.1 hypothetical protein [Providencia rettgeri]EJD6614920.1 hypothetical protein [Providencia rettgeri]ELL9150605.1 hypothetical protein [Providencia rettgeri]ELR5148670.1 hypothetical protein [Providencia rettgeri]